ncbi:MAG: NFACT family protein, partial [Candidatus Heimdallarchaeota archaeon]|nr:NFACT family protein [Candidatus Heimdallarchaeota archaeon]
MKASMSNFDINAIISELTQRCSKSELKNIFELNDKFFFRFRTRTEGTLLLVIEPGKRIHVTKFKRDFPPSPSGLCKAFRIHIKGKWLKSIYQYDFDRICVLEFEAYEKVYTLIVELFGKGNLILLSPQDKILVAKNYKKMRDRDIHPGIEFKFPPSTGRNFIEADLDWVKETLLERKEKDIISLISKTLNINKIFAQEICLRMSLDTKLKSEDITDEIIDSIIAGVKKLRRDAKSKKLKPIIYRDSKTKEIVEIS